MINPLVTPPHEQPSWRRAAYGALRGMTSALTMFVVVVATLLLINQARMARTSPTETPGLEGLLARLAENPEDAALRDQVRALDLLVRRAYFTGREFARTGAWLLAIGTGLLLVALQGMRLLRPPPPVLPGGPGDGRSDWGAGVIGRRLLAGFVVLWIAVALISGWLAARGYDPAATAGRLLTETAPGELPDPDWVCPVAAGRDEVAVDPAVWRCQWPAFRGPDGNGVAPSGASVPDDWDGPARRNVRWRARVPRPGFSSPIVWEDQVFVTGGDREQRELYAFAADTGNLLWRCPTEGAGFVPEVTDDTGYASPTPVTNGHRVFAIFATGELICVDFAGRRRWQVNLRRPDNPYGFASSLRLHHDLIFVQYDNADGGELLAFDVRNGQQRWRVPRTVETSWATPLLATLPDGSPFLVLHAPPRTIAYDPLTGRELWATPSRTGELALCPGWADGVLVIHDDEGDIQAFDVIRQATRWSTREEIPDVSSPLATGELVILATSYGPVVCLDQHTGELLWRHEFPEGFWGSPTMVGERILLVGMSGVTRIFAATREFRELATPALGERSVCSPAIADGRLYLRGYEHLFAIGTNHQP